MRIPTTGRARAARLPLLLAVLAATLAAGWPAPVRAETVSVSADLPITYSFKESRLQDAKPLGVVAGLVLPLPAPLTAGVGAELYSVKGNVPNLSSKFTYRVLMLDGFIVLPVPVVRLVAGVGIGNGKFDTDPSSGAFGGALLGQVYGTAGFTVLKGIEAHLGYHLIRGEADIANSGGGKLNLDASMATLGVTMEF